MRLAIVSDSHIPERETAIPEPFGDRIADADHTIHVGDVQTADALATLRDRSTELTAVRGNVDPPDLDLPSVATVENEGVTVVVTHGAVNPASRDPAISGDPESWQEGESVVRDGTDWLEAVTATARIVASEGVTDRLDRASTPGPVELDTEAAERVADAAADASDPEGTVIGIGGHSHRVVEDTNRGVTVLNPGTVTGADPGPRTTMMTVELSDGDADVTLHELDEN